MTTSSHCGRRAVACALVAIAAAAVSVAGKPYTSYTQDDYARAVLAQYFPGAASSKVIELTPTELPEPTSFRSSRSDDRWAVKSPPLVGHGHPDGPQAVSVVAVPCKAAVADRSHANDTSSAVTVEKLSAFYEQLKSQQETLARQQFQQQLYEQQQRRQQEFALMQQQIQQQYYQQQQHAMFMLDQMRRNPAFVGQLAAFVNHTPTFNAYNGTSVALALPKAHPEVAAHDCAEKPPAKQEKDQTIGNHMVIEQDNDSDDSGAKRLDARQVARQKVTSSSSSSSSSSDKHKPVTYDEDNENDEYDPPASFEDDQSPPKLEKVYSSMANE
ncbi:unnamed protein product [Macrosiphum euphorbiae]|uniref:Uncharacterized protein n=1 Tax=Macrosiphum euphorbiae TaxID=13131 RepID=A0AAV0XKH7_9HEMI|nr:unnamed protein product [Macrosiphum euphorbiae]